MVAQKLWRKQTKLLLIALCVVLFVAACGPGDGAENRSESEVVAEEAGSLSGLLPDDIRERGWIKFAASMDYPPLEFLDTDGTTPVGMDIELGDAIGDLLGVDVRWQNANFDGLIAGVAAKRYDAAIGLQDSQETQKEADFVDFFANSNVVVFPPDGSLEVSNVLDMCGKAVANQRGSNTTVDITEHIDPACEAAGKPKVDLSSFQDQNQMLLAFKSKRVKLASFGLPAAAYILKDQPDLFEFATFRDLIPDLPNNLTAIAVPKGSDQLLDALHGALQELLDNGTYHAIMAKWGLEDLAIDEVTVNTRPYEKLGN